MRSYRVIVTRPLKNSAPTLFVRVLLYFFFFFNAMFPIFAIAVEYLRHIRFDVKDFLFFFFFRKRSNYIQYVAKVRVITHYFIYIVYTVFDDASTPKLIISKYVFVISCSCFSR